jgi:hypothetical protein
MRDVELETNACCSALSEAFTSECERASAFLVDGQGLAEVFKVKQNAS